MSDTSSTTTGGSQHQAVVPQVVFACVRNGGRSVISRVLTEHYARGRVIALSAGTQPGERIHPEVADALDKLGLDPSRETPTLLTRETIAASTVAITLGCGEECPYVPGVTYIDWPVADPGGQDEPTVRAIVPTSTTPRPPPTHPAPIRHRPGPIRPDRQGQLTYPALSVFGALIG